MKKLKEFRESKGLNKRNMAFSIGVSASYYYKVESGKQAPSFDFLKKLKSKYPDVNIDEVFFK